MQNNNTISKSDLLALFERIEKELPNCVWWKGCKLDGIIHKELYPNTDEEEFPLPVVLDFNALTQANTITSAMIYSLLVACGDVKVYVCILGSLVTFSEIDIWALNNSNLIIDACDAFRLTFHKMDLRHLPNFLYPQVTNVELIECTINSSFESVDLSSISLVKMSDFSNVEKFRSLNSVTIRYEHPDHIPSSWTMFPSDLGLLRIEKLQSIGNFNAKNTSNVIPVEKFNNLSKNFSSINEFVIRLYDDVFDGPIHAVSFSLISMNELTYKVDDKLITKVLTVIYMCMVRDANVDNLLWLQEKLIEMGLSKYAR